MKKHSYNTSNIGKFYHNSPGDATGSDDISWNGCAGEYGTIGDLNDCIWHCQGYILSEADSEVMAESFALWRDDGCPNVEMETPEWEAKYESAIKEKILDRVRQKCLKDGHANGNEWAITSDKQLAVFLAGGVA